jgi:hypothetical protein
MYPPLRRRVVSPNHQGAAVDEHNVLLRQQDAAAPHHGVIMELVDLIKHPINPMKPGRMGRVGAEYGPDTNQ